MEDLGAAIPDDFPFEGMKGYRLSFLSHPEASAGFPCLRLGKAKFFVIPKGKPGIGPGIPLADYLLVEKCPILQEDVGQQASVDIDLLLGLEFQTDPSPRERVLREL